MTQRHSRENIGIPEIPEKTEKTKEGKLAEPELAKTRRAARCEIPEHKCKRGETEFGSGLFGFAFWLCSLALLVENVSAGESAPDTKQPKSENETKTKESHNWR